MQLIKYNNYSTSCNDLLTISIWVIFVLRIFTNFCSIQFHRDRHFKNCGVFYGILLQNFTEMFLSIFGEQCHHHRFGHELLKICNCEGLDHQPSRSWKTCAIIMDRFWNPQESR
jgi:hypothetical protein